MVDLINDGWPPADRDGEEWEEEQEDEYCDEAYTPPFAGKSQYHPDAYDRYYDR